MAAGHDKLCEDADVGSLCDCSCAGAKHAIKHTKGGVPGAGAVSKAAQKAAQAAGKAPVINNRAQPKDGSKIAPAAPKTFKDAQKSDTGKDRVIQDAATGKPISRAEAAERMFGTKAAKEKLAKAGAPKGASHAELVAAEAAGDKVHVHRHNPDKGAWERTTEKPVSVASGIALAQNGIAHRQTMRITVVRSKAAAGKPSKLELKPGALQLSGQTPEVGTRVVHEQHGPGTIAAKGRASAPAVVEFDHPASGKRMVERHTLFAAKDVAAYDGKPVPAATGTPGISPERLTRGQKIIGPDGSVHEVVDTTPVFPGKTRVYSKTGQFVVDNNTPLKAADPVTAGGKGGPDAARRDVMAVTSRRRNGDASAEGVPKPRARKR